MKSHLRALPAPKLLTWGIAPDGDAANILAKLCREQNILLESVPAQRAGDPLGLLAGYAGFSQGEPWTGPIPAGDAIVFCGMEQKTVGRFLDQLRENHVPIRLKAILTAHNQKWPFAALLEELEKEHQALHQK